MFYLKPRAIHVGLKEVEDFANRARVLGIELAWDGDKKAFVVEKGGHMEPRCSRKAKDAMMLAPRSTQTHGTAPALHYTALAADYNFWQETSK